MSKWLNQYAFMVTPRKPWPCENEYHSSISCGMSAVLFAFELVEGKDA
jgi:hypothetical protein